MASDHGLQCCCLCLVFTPGEPEFTPETQPREDDLSPQGSTYLVAPAVHPQLLLTSLGKGKGKQSLLYRAPCAASCGQVNAGFVVTSTHDEPMFSNVSRQGWSTCLPLGPPTLPLRVPVTLVSNMASTDTDSKQQNKLS